MSLTIRYFGLRDYPESYRQMVEFTRNRDQATRDEIWFLQHPPVYTLGLAGKAEHLLDTGDIPVIRTDRGGQVTYHGPGQLMVYLLLDLKRKRISIRSLVDIIEQTIIDMLAGLGLQGDRRSGAPGVYIDGNKLAALGIRVRNGCSYHGFCLNVDLDLSPYHGINPCGYAGLEATRLKDYGIAMDVWQTTGVLLPYLLKNLAYEPDAVEVITAEKTSGTLEATA